MADKEKKKHTAAKVTAAVIIGGVAYGTLKKKKAHKQQDLNSWWKR